jgi:hypothetical protein
MAFFNRIKDMAGSVGTHLRIFRVHCRNNVHVSGSVGVGSGPQYLAGAAKHLTTNLVSTSTQICCSPSHTRHSLAAQVAGEISAFTEDVIAQGIEDEDRGGFRPSHSTALMRVFVPFLFWVTATQSWDPRNQSRPSLACFCSPITPV